MDKLIGVDVISGVPSCDGGIDWDALAVNYFEHILSPFAPVMVAPDKDTGPCRNPLVNWLRQQATSLKGCRLLDFGCGPGNLLRFLPKDVGKVTGIDLSAKAIDIARSKAERLGIKSFVGLVNPLVKQTFNDDFDVIVSVNSILPDSRGEVVRILKRLADLLSDKGRVLAIMPSFDTTLYLRELNSDHLRAQGLPESRVAHSERAFNRRRRLCERSLAFADDGLHIQCYHTPESILNEASLAGLAVVEGPTKVYYPWALTQKFGYGHYPWADEEIWDWFVVFERAKP